MYSLRFFLETHIKVSFRKLPRASFNEMRKICEHYEAKCEGQYESLATRYILQMGHEIRAQIDNLECGSCNDCTKTHHYVKTAQSQEENHDKTGHISINEKDNPVQDVRTANINKGSLKSKVDVLENALQEAKNQIIQYKERASQRNDDYYGLKKNYEKCCRDLKDLRVSLEDERKRHANELERVKSDSKRIIKFVRSKANEALIDIETKHQEIVKNLNQNLVQQENEYKNHISAHLGNLEHQICDAVRSEKAAIENGIYCMGHNTSKILTSSQVANIPGRKSQQFFRDDTVSTVSDDTPIDRSQSLEGLANAIVENFAIGFQSILDQKQKLYEHTKGSPRSKSGQENRRKRPPNIIPI